MCGRLGTDADGCRW